MTWAGDRLASEMVMLFCISCFPFIPLACISYCCISFDPEQPGSNVIRKESDQTETRCPKSCRVLITSGTHRLLQRTLTCPRVILRQLPLPPNCTLSPYIPLPVISEAPNSLTPFHILCQLLHVLFPQVRGAVNICTAVDKEKANRVSLFMSLGTRCLDSSRQCFFFPSPGLLEQ